MRKSHPLALFGASVAGFCAAPLGGACVATASSELVEGIEVVLLSRDLTTTPATLVGFEDGSPVVADGTGAVRTVPASELSAVVRPDWLPGVVDPRATDALIERRSKQASIELTTGERLIGAFPPDAMDNPESLRIGTSFAGTLEASLEEIRVVRFRPTPEGTPAPEDSPRADRVILSNADIVEGFFERFGSSVVIETDAGVVELPIDGVAEVRLVNPPTRLSGTAIWLADGTVAGVSSLEVRGTSRSVPFLVVARPGLQATGPNARPGSASGLSIRALAYDTERLTPLSRLRVLRQEATEGRRFTDPVIVESDDEQPLWAGALRVRGPMVVEWALPEGSAGLAGWVRLDERAGAWGDCDALVEVLDGQGNVRASRRQRINARAGAVRLDLGFEPSRGGRLRLTLESGAYGPIRDWLVLERWVVYSDPPRPAPNAG